MSELPEEIGREWHSQACRGFYEEWKRLGGGDTPYSPGESRHGDILTESRHRLTQLNIQWSIKNESISPRVAGAAIARKCFGLGLTHHAQLPAPIMVAMFSHFQPPLRLVVMRVNGDIKLRLDALASRSYSSNFDIDKVEQLVVNIGPQALDQ